MVQGRQVKKTRRERGALHSRRQIAVGIEIRQRHVILCSGKCFPAGNHKIKSCLMKYKNTISQANPR